jgi:hypothetical protein
MITTRKNFLLLLSFFIILILLILITGMGSVDFSPGTLFDPANSQKIRALLYHSRNLLYLLIVLIFAVPMLIFLLSYRRTSGKPAETRRRRNILITIIQVGLWIAALLVLRRRITEDQFPFNPPNLGQIDINNMESAPLPEIRPMSDVSTFVLTLIILLSLSVVIFLALRRKKESSKPLDRISYIALQSASELRNGKEFNDVILKCYHEMTRVLVERKSITRGRATTAREFEHSLVRMGLPEKPVGLLTRLFEQVRYGEIRSGRDDEKEAIWALEEIINACR